MAEDVRPDKLTHELHTLNKHVARNSDDVTARNGKELIFLTHDIIMQRLDA
jgi:hypothetical protein